MVLTLVALCSIALIPTAVAPTSDSAIAIAIAPNCLTVGMFWGAARIVETPG